MPIVESYAKQVLYDVQWQRLRVSLLGKWGRPDSTVAAIDILREYIRTPPYGVKVWRCLNLLNAVLLGYRGGSKHYCWSIVHEAREKFRDVRWTMYPNLETGELLVWSWDKVIADLNWVPEKELALIQQNLRARIRSAQQKAKGKSGYNPQLRIHTRPELVKFLMLVDNEFGRRAPETYSMA